MQIADSLPLRENGEHQVLWIRGGNASDIYAEAEQRMCSAKALALAFCLARPMDEVEPLVDAIGAIHLLISDAEALYRAARVATKQAAST